MENIHVRISGKLSPKVLPLFAEVLGSMKLARNEIIFFCSYSAYDIPAGHCFSEILNNDKTTKCRIILKEISQQFFKPFDEIPHGWKTVCKFEFPDGIIPSAVMELPALDGWGYEKHFLIFQ
ncbi:hypothetical protein [Chitinophaga sp. Cy-1792]|uniref:hypothetical protein n=1 Tax=Chitinophaga sp. Cy-1792 TaxID=2608339 RepID=UPI001423D712|nr:hypothetical protein [Chitinophaga sp. Cy-1792]NIG55727.1 hypothetical protein [Chitinophaga sp. Cy-1792]